MQTRDPGFFVNNQPGFRISGAPLRFAPRCTARDMRGQEQHHRL